MTGSLERVRLVTGKLLRQNRVLLVLLLLWPFVLSAIVLLADHGHPAVEDVAAILQQELFYGLALVSLGASVALGTEQRARRVQGVLGRAVGRGEYLLALGLSAFLPFAGYVAVWLVNAGAFAGLMRLRTPMLAGAFVAELAAGLLLCAVGLLLSVLLPQLLAAVGNGLVLAGLFASGKYGWGGVARVFSEVSGELVGLPRLWAGIGEAVLAAVVLAALAAVLFSRKDIALI